MTHRSLRVSAVGGLAVALLLAGCTSDEAAPPAVDDGNEQPVGTGDTTNAGDNGDDPTDAGDSGGEQAVPDTDAPGDYQASAVTNAVAVSPDGSTFTPADFAGKTVFVETFATWCSKCRSQLNDTNQAAAQASDNAVFLILSVETDLDPARLASYRTDNGFTNLTHFGVMTPEALATFVDQFGRSVANAPSTPKFTIAPDGSLSELKTGFESVEEILAQLA